MSTTTNIQCIDLDERYLGGQGSPSGFTPRNVAKLISWIAGLMLFFLVIGPWGRNHIPYFRETAQFITENDIQANEYFYTEVPRFIEAQQYMRAVMKYQPCGGGKQP